MFQKSAAALALAGAIILTAPSVSLAGPEVQQYQHMSSTTTSAYGAPAAYGNYAPAPAPSYVRPMSSYYGSPYVGPCATTPYGYGAACPPAPCNPCGGGGGGGLFSNPVFTAGLVGLGLGYLIWH